MHARDPSGMHPIHVACMKSDARATKAAIEVLLAASADVNARDNDGFTPLHSAIFNNHTEAAAVAIRALVAAGSWQSS